MQSVKRVAEWYLGLPPADAGEGTAWNLVSQTPWPVWFPQWLALLVVLAGLACVVLVSWRETRALTRSRRLGLLTLRLITVLLILALLTEATLSIDRTGLPYVAVLVDTSASMGLQDDYSDDEAAGRPSRRNRTGSTAENGSRLELAKSLLLSDSARVLRAIQAGWRLRLYQFADTAVPVGNQELQGEEQLADLVSRLESLRPEGDATRPGPAMAKVLNDFRGAPPAAVVVITDGRASTTEAEKLSSAAADAAARFVPVHAIGVGSEQPARDLELTELMVDEVAFVDDPVQFVATVKSYGFAGQTAEVVLREEDSDVVLVSQQVQLTGEGGLQRVDLVHTISEDGEYAFIVEIVPHPKEVDTHNNRQIRHVSVRRERIRVLLADGLPRYEFRYLKHLLERDRTITLRTVLQDADLEYATEDETALEHFPVRRDELFEFDVLILGDVSPELIGTGVLEHIAEFVREKGGGIILIAGVQYNPQAWDGTPLADLIPVELTPQAGSPTERRPPDGRETVVSGFRPQLTSEGAQSASMFRLAETTEQSERIWNSLPELYWMFESTGVKPGAIVFARHPNRWNGASPMPVIAMHRYGAGKVLFHATDESWRWRFRAGDRYYGRYWVQAIRFLSRSRLLGKERLVELSSDRGVYRRGETAQLRLRFLDERLIPADAQGVSVLIETRDGRRQETPLRRSAASMNIFEGEAELNSLGMHHAWVRRPSFDEAPPAIDFRVNSPERELADRSMDRADLRLTAEQTRGKYYTIGQAGDIARELPRGEPVPLDSGQSIPLWNRGEVLLLLAGLLTLEWVFRKRARLV